MFNYVFGAVEILYLGELISDTDHCASRAITYGESVQSRDGTNIVLETSKDRYILVKLYEYGFITRGKDIYYVYLFYVALRQVRVFVMEYRAAVSRLIEHNKIVVWFVLQLVTQTA